MNLTLAKVVDAASERDVVIWLVVSCIALAVAAYEVAGLTLPGWHTISYYAYLYWPVRGAVSLLFVAAAIWWLIHSGHPHAR